MKKNQVNMILVDQTKRKNKIISNFCVIFVIFILIFSFFTLFLTTNKAKYVKYTEKSELDYKVYLKDNDFFENNYLGEENKFIASLIDYIDAEFNYNLEVEEKDIDYQYSYRVESDVIVKEKGSNKDLYRHKEDLIEEKTSYSNSYSIVNINEKLKIDYNYYNNIIKKFINLYSLNDVESTLNINMYVTVVGDCEEIEDANTESVISLAIPLTTNTVQIDMKYDLVDENEEKLMACTEQKSSGIIYLLISIILLAIDVALTVKLVIYIMRTRTAETIYEKELKKILNNYRSYIQKINNNFDLTGYQVLKVDTFTDMLEIRDTVNQPILMVESKDKTGTFFIIPTTTKVLYIYALKITEIKQQLEEKNKEDVL